jgi:glycosyltransferase involved in cell wall biosynthesis
LRIDIKVTVVVPVYKAEKYVKQAVESALAQPQTAEVILIEDGSPDNSFEECKQLAEQHKKVRMLRHPQGDNRGAAASRNLGMQNAKYDYIAFLDADDYYLPGRFTKAQEIIDANPDCDGVYEALGIHFEDQDAKKRWLNSQMENIEMTTMTKITHPDNLFERLVTGGSGYFSLVSLILNKRALVKVGLMNEKLTLHQDSEFILRLAAATRLLPGRLDQPVAMRRVHKYNRISAPRPAKEIFQNRMHMWLSTYDWMAKNHFNTEKQIVIDMVIRYQYNFKPLPGWMEKWSPKVRKLTRILSLPFDHPRILLQKQYWGIILSIFLWPFSKNARNKF